MRLALSIYFYCCTLLKRRYQMMIYYVNHSPIATWSRSCAFYILTLCTFALRVHFPMLDWQRLITTALDDFRTVCSLVLYHYRAVRRHWYEYPYNTVPYCKFPPAACFAPFPRAFYGTKIISSFLQTSRFVFVAHIFSYCAFVFAGDSTKTMPLHFFSCCHPS